MEVLKFQLERKWLLFFLVFQDGTFFIFTQELTKGRSAANVTVNHLADYLTGRSKIFLCIQLH